jgi:hypothetical protein
MLGFRINDEKINRGSLIGLLGHLGGKLALLNPVLIFKKINELIRVKYILCCRPTGYFNILSASFSFYF